jgi:hypothetical protein
VPDSVLAGTSGEAQVRAALAEIPQSERAAVVLRDAYDLPPQAVAVALRRDLASADALTAQGRLHLVGRYDDRPPPQLDQHTGRTAVDPVSLSRLADGSLPPPRTVALRRHLPACPACEEMVDTLAKGRRLAVGLPVLAMPDEEREALLERVAVRAAAVLPSVEEVLAAVEQDEGDRPLVAPVVAVGAVVLALVLGVAVAALVSGGGSGTRLPSSGLPSLPSLSPSFSVPASHPSASATPTPRRSSASPTSSARAKSATPTPRRSSPPPSRPASVAVSPTRGPRGTTITVAGSGYPPGVTVTITYAGPISSSTSTARANEQGSFVTQISANGLVPGSYTVQAQGGGRSASAGFDQTT